MLNSSTLSDSCTASPIFYVDNISSYLLDDSINYSASYYYHSPSPLIYSNEIEHFTDFITNHDLSIIQQPMLAHNNEINNNCSIDIPDDSSILEHDTKMDSNNIINGIVEDNAEMNHIISTSTTTASHTHGVKIKKKRSSNKDRHSKIWTAHGLRDRRMRLSLQVADPFFKLQDRLGYDKASATVEWLFMQAKPAIDELLRSKHGSPPSGVTTTKCTTTSSNSDVDCEVESTAIEEMEGDNAKVKRASRASNKEPKPQKRKRTTKEERKVARERAKRRTLEKMQSRGQAKGGGNVITNSFRNHYQQSLDISQNVPSYKISAQQNIMGGPL